LLAGGGIIMGASTIERRPSRASQIKPSEQKKQELRAAVERVYRKYGNDLAAFRRDTQRELEKRG
jgi:hypothetical protein